MSQNGLHSDNPPDAVEPGKAARLVAELARGLELRNVVDENARCSALLDLVEHRRRLEAD